MHNAAMQNESQTDIYKKVEEAILYLESHFYEQPDLETVAKESGLSPFHFQRLFKQLAGISPKRFLQYTTLEEAKKLLTKNANLLDVSFDVGLSGPGRLHDLFLAGEAVTPGEYKTAGKGISITYGIHESPFGYALVGLTNQGLCELDFRSSEREIKQAVNKLQQKWNAADIKEQERSTSHVLDAIFTGKKLPRLHLRGTNFQLKVWQALLAIPDGALSSYSEIAEAIGSPKAVRAVGSAVGDNPIAYLIPCHRVLRKDGGIGGYATGTARKRAMLAYEALKAAR